MINNKGKEHVEFVKKKKRTFSITSSPNEIPVGTTTTTGKEWKVVVVVIPFFLEWWMTLSIKRSTSTIIILQWERKPQNPAQEKKKVKINK